jgi:hypothetical protein
MNINMDLNGISRVTKHLLLMNGDVLNAYLPD